MVEGSGCDIETSQGEVTLYKECPKKNFQEMKVEAWPFRDNIFVRMCVIYFKEHTKACFLLRDFASPLQKKFLFQS